MPSKRKGRSSRHRSHGAQEVHDLLKVLDNLLAMPGGTPKAARDRLTKANELARKAMQFAATGVNIKEPVKRFIIELEARKDIPPKMLYSLFCLVAPWDQSIATMIAGLLAARCADHDETVRRASLQQLTSLRIASLVDVMLPPVERLLDDESAAVRAAAVLAVLKIATLADADVDLGRFWTRVDEMLRGDPSAEVRHACVALKLQREDEATVVKDAALVEDLMLRLRELEPHQQAAVLALAKRYEPGEAKTTSFGHPEPGVPQVAAFMDTAEPCLYSVYTATVLAAIDALLCWARGSGNEYWYSQALNRVKRPLYSLSRHADPEIAVVGLCHVSLLVQQTPYGFSDDYQQFFVRHSDPSYVKQKKIDVLKYLATEDNQVVLVNELMEYTKDRDVHTCRAAVRALAHVVLSVESSGLIESLMDLLTTGDSTVVSETILVLKDILRRFPDAAAPYAPTLQALPAADLQTDEAAAAYFWLRAQLACSGLEEGEGVEPAAYVFEEFAEKWGTLSVLTKTELLFATARLALVRAPVALPVLRKVLFLGLRDEALGVADAARFIHSAFATSLDAASALLDTAATTAPPVAGDTSAANLRELMGEFNTLAVVYGQPARTFVDRSALVLRTVPPAAAAEGEGGADDVAEGDFMEDSAEAQLLDLGPSDNGDAEPAGSMSIDTGLDDLMGLGGGGGTAAVEGAPEFDASGEMSKDAFAAAWAALDGTAQEVRLPLTGEKPVALLTQEPRPLCGLHGALADANVKIFAEGPQGGFMFACQSGSGTPVFIQYGITEQPGAAAAELVAGVRSSDATLISHVVKLWRERIEPYLATL